ncbi:DUF6080 domain-containing protein [Xylanibacter muris]|uniref:GtrA family protein n=1 Tax=Xylanibacter muris TaxID=2736290 RepID=A0ABX2AK34_9BACT|nr:DUF6080 domain-containing protein [Xylanibacter muris]NPD91095.1 GtrA family protein [Xylanibacter muris]
MRLLDIFRIRKEERIPSLVALTVIILLNAMFVARMYDKFTPLMSHSETVRTMLRNFHVSGYDPLTLITISSWTDGYNVYRHPLLAFMMYPLYLLNTVLGEIFGINCALFICAVLMSVCSFYSFVFLRRILTDVIGLGKTDAGILAALFFSFGYVLVISFTPDHFGLSMCMFLIVLYVSGMRIRKSRIIPSWQMALLNTFATGITSTNTVKIVLAQMFVNGSRFFHWRNIAFAVILPVVLLWFFCRFEYKVFVLPGEKARHEARARKKAEQRKKEDERTARLIAASPKDSVEIRRRAKVTAAAKRRRRAGNQGKPISNGEFMRWSDITTPRAATLVENFFGEPLILHEKHLLGDVFLRRPVFVKYESPLCYAAEAVAVGLLLLGIWLGRRSRLLWLCLSWFACDMALHLGIGFGINEVFIMSPHWLFVFPIVYAFILRHPKCRFPARIAFASLTAFLIYHNLPLLMSFLFI